MGYLLAVFKDEEALSLIGTYQYCGSVTFDAGAAANGLIAYERNYPYIGCYIFKGNFLGLIAIGY